MTLSREAIYDAIAATSLCLVKRLIGGRQKGMSIKSFGDLIGHGRNGTQAATNRKCYSLVCNSQIRDLWMKSLEMRADIRGG
jgi:hypothetical protein